MEDNSIDLSKYERYGDKWYKKGKTRWDSKPVKNLKIIRQLDVAAGYRKPPTPRHRLKLSKQWNKLFDTKLVNGGGHVKNWARPLALHGGKNPEYGWKRFNFDSSEQYWGAKRNRGSLGAGGVLVGSKGWIRQIQISIHQLAINAEYFRIAVGHRAMKVFQDSFKYQQFWASGGQKWAALSSYTLKKRAKRGTGSKILKEYGDLYKSLRFEANSERGTEIYTDIVPANAGHHKKHSICYAGYHNEGKGTYGNGWGKRRPKPYIRRQFMGHSDKIDQFAFSIMKRYLFDSVFMVRKV